MSVTNQIRPAPRSGRASSARARNPLAAASGEHTEPYSLDKVPNAVYMRLFVPDTNMRFGVEALLQLWPAMQPLLRFRSILFR